MDPQATVTRAVWQEKVRQLIGMGYPLDAAYAAAAQQVGTPDFNTSLNQVSAPGDQSAAVPPAALGQPNPQAQQAIADVTAPGKPTPPTPPPIRDNASADYPGRPPKNNGGTPPAGGAGSQGGQPPSTGSNQSSTNDVVQPGQGGSGAAPAQAADPNQAGPQSSGAYPGATPAEQATQFYGFGQQDTPETYAARIFKGAGPLGAEKGFNGLDFSDERITGSPWGQFLQSRYLPEVQSDMTLGRLAGGDDSSDFNQNLARSVLTNVAQGGGAPAGGGMAGLKNMASSLANFDPSKTTGMSQSQASTLEQLYNDPKAQAQTILGQMQGATGGWGMNFLRNELANQAQLSYDNPSQYPLNSFASRVMPMIGMGS